MFFAPLPHMIDINGVAEVVLVLRFAQPTALTFGLAGLATPGLGAKLLMPPIPGVG